MVDPKIFFWISESVADAAAVNPEGIKMTLANSISKFLIKGKPSFVMAHKVYMKIFQTAPS